MRTIHLLALITCFQAFFIGSLAQLTFPSSYIKLPGSGITFYFEFDDDAQILKMGLDMSEDVDYFAVGFADEGNYQMTSFDLVTFIFVPNNDTENTYTTLVQDLHCVKNGHPPTDLQLGGTADYNLTQAYVTTGKRQVLFQRAYDTKDQYDYLYNPTKMRTSIVMNWAFNNAKRYTLYNHHGNAGTVISQMYNGFQGTAKEYNPGGLSPKVVIAVHGYLMLFAWGILVEVMLQVGRYMKHVKFFVSMHLALGTLLYAATAVMTGLALYIRWGEVSGSVSTAHFYLGFITVGLCTIQAVLGLLLGIKITSAKITKLIPGINKSHIILGVLVYLLTKAQIGIGLNLFKPNLMWCLYVYYALIVIFRVVQEYWYRVEARLGGKDKKNYINGPDSQADKHQKLLELLNNDTPASEIFEMPELKDLKWAVLDDKVFDLKEFTHPGGNFILNQINGREVGRFIYGSYGLESLTQDTQHFHSNQALKVMQRNFVGTIQNKQQLITKLYADTDTSPMPKNSSPGKAYNLNQTRSEKRPSTETAQPLLSGQSGSGLGWTLQSKTEISPLIAKFVFTTNDYFINPLVKDIRSLGKHMKISHASQKKIRLYTLVLSQTETRTKRREILWKNFQKKETTMVRLVDDPRFESLPLLIKRYDNADTNNTNSDHTTFSSFLHNCHSETRGFKIEGPFGPGLGLTLDSTGLHYIFTCGTGIFPFLDLFDFLLESVLDPDSTHNIFKNGFKLHVHAGFSEINDFVGLDICTKLVEACRRSGMKDAFKLTLRAKDAESTDLYTVTRDSFDNAFVEKYLDRQCEKVYICGPPSFNQRMPAALSLIGLSKTRIILV